MLRFPSIFQACLVLLIAAMLAGCDDSPEVETNENPFLSVKVNIAVPAGHDFAEPWGVALDEWMAITHASVELTEYTLEAGKPLSQSWPEDVVPDVILFPTYRAAELDEAGLLAAMPVEVRKDEDLAWLDYFDGVRKYVTPLQRSPAIVPAGTPVLTCYYRQDLFKAAELSPPSTWTEYQELVTTVGDWGNGLPVVEPWSESFRASMFLARSASVVKHSGFFSTLFDIETGAPLIATRGYQKTLNDVVTNLHKLPPEVLSYSPADCRRLILSGKAAMAITMETGEGNPDLYFASSSSEQTDKQEWTRSNSINIGFCPLPGSEEAFNRSTSEFEAPLSGDINRVSLTGFAGLSMGVTVSEDNVKRAAAWNLLVTLISEPTYSTVFTSGRRQLCRSSQAEAPSMWVGVNLEDDEAQAYVAAVQNSLRGTQVIKELPVIGADQFRAALTAGISKALSKEAAPAEALSEIDQAWAAISKEVGVDKVRNSYRRSLGLTNK